MLLEKTVCSLVVQFLLISLEASYYLLSFICFQDEGSVEDLSPQELLWRHVRRAKRVRASKSL
uniref:Uncharacterized protein n=1 Tax=Nelumbo nucifera TaxID=4432 RepID=A0A822ZAP3_NELNU|nr:TPA_asm: hypothetical protein HUJ06_000412 [Nelumbo nucifera]